MALAFATVFLGFAGAQSADNHPCSSLVVRTDKGDYAVGEPVTITVTFHPLLPGCAMPMIAHDYVVQIDVLNVSNQTLYSVSNLTGATLMVSETWIPTTAGEYTITASAYFRLLGEEFMTKMLEASTTIRTYAAMQMPEFGLIAVGGLAFAVVALGLLFFGRAGRLRKAA